MPITPGNTQIAEANAVTTITVTKPTGLVDGDVLVAMVTATGATKATTIPAGFSEWGTVAPSNALTVTMYTKVVSSAAGEPANYTWSGFTTGRATAIMQRFAGVDTTTPRDVASMSSASNQNATTVVVPAITTTAADCWLVGAAGQDSSTGTITVPSGWTQSSQSTGTGRRSAFAGVADPTAGSTGTVTWTFNSGTLAHGALLGALRPAGGAPAAPVLDQRMVGIGRVKVKTTNATSVRLKLGTDTGVTSGVTYTSAQTPDAQGYTLHDVSGLAVDSTFYYRVAMTDSGSVETLDTSSTVGRIRTKASSGFAFCFGSCSDGDSAAMSAIAARADDLFLHLGDFVYADGSGTSMSNFRAQWDAGLTRANHAAVFATTPTTFGPSDHDGLQNNWVGTADTTARDNYNAVVREKTAQVPVPATTGTYFSFEWGPICFIVTDGRSFKSANAATDNSSKTLLGATQLQWVKDTAAATTKRAIVVVGDVPLGGAANVDDDEWNNYNTERQDLFGYLNGLAPTKRVAYIHGDMHALGADDGTNSGITPGVPAFCGAPLNQTFSIKAGPYSAGTWPSSGTAQAYGRIVVSESPSSVTLAYTGYSSDNTARVTQTTTFTYANALTRSVGDSAAASDGTTDVVAQARAAADAAAASDTTARSVGRGRSIGDTAPAPDATARTSTRARSMTDTAAATDALSRSGSRSRALADVASSTDTLTRSQTRTRALGDAAAASDTTAASSTGNVQRSVSDSAPAIDALARQGTRARALADAAATADTSTRSSTRSRALSDSATTSDTTAAGSTGNLTRSIGDSAPAVDTSTRGSARARAAADSAAAADSSTRRVARTRAISDVAAALDLSVRAMSAARARFDSAAAVDSLASSTTSSSGTYDDVVAATIAPRSVSASLRQRLATGRLKPRDVTAGVRT